MRAAGCVLESRNKTAALVSGLKRKYLRRSLCRSFGRWRMRSVHSPDLLPKLCSHYKIIFAVWPFNFPLLAFQCQISTRKSTDLSFGQFLRRHREIRRDNINIWKTQSGRSAHVRLRKKRLRGQTKVACKFNFGLTDLSVPSWGSSSSSALLTKHRNHSENWQMSRDNVAILDILALSHHFSTCKVMMLKAHCAKHATITFVTNMAQLLQKQGHDTKLATPNSSTVAFATHMS